LWGQQRSGSPRARLAAVRPHGHPAGQLAALLGSFPVPALAACTSFHPAEAVIEMKVPMNQLIGLVLLQGLGIPLRAELAAGADEWDLLDDSFTRMALPDEIPIVDSP